MPLLASRRIIWNMIAGVIDGPDPDAEPDIIPAQGSVDFEASVQYVPITGLTPKSTLLMTAFKGIFDEVGDLCTPDPSNPKLPGAKGVRWFVNNDPAMAVKGWTLKVTPRFDVINAKTPSIPPFSISLPYSLEDLDLGDFLTVPSAPGIGTPQAFAMLDLAKAAATESATFAEEAAAVALQVKADADAGVFDGTPGAPGNPGEPGKDGSNVIPTDQAVAGNILDPQTETARALSGTIGSQVSVLRPTMKPIGNLLAAVGDSITGYNGSLVTQNPGWFNKLVVESQGRVKHAGTFATGGWTMEQIETDHVPQVIAAIPRPGACIVFGGTNNTGANAGLNFNFETTKATHARILAKLEAAGVLPILALIPPRSFNQLLRDNVAQWNAYIRALAVSGGYPLFDAHTPLNDGSGSFKAGTDQGDGVHPNELGHELIAKYNIANGFLENFTSYQRPPSYYKELVGNGRFTVDTSGWGTNPSNSPANIALSIVAPDGGDLLRGKWLKADYPVGSAGGFMQSLLASGWAVGDTIECTARLRTTGFTGNGAKFFMGVLMLGAEASPRGIYQWTRDTEDGLFRVKTTIPAGTTNLYFRAGTSGTPTGIATVLLGEVSVKNLSQPTV